MKPRKGHIYALRTCDADLKSYGGFQWPDKGNVTCSDFKPIAECGNGLHALENGVGNGSLLDWSVDAKWLVVEVKASEVIQLSGKIKFPSCKVVHCGDRLSATTFLHEAIGQEGIVGSFVAAGDYGTATAGNYGTATAGNCGTATAGNYGTATAGYRGTATAGDYGTATAGNCGTATAGYSGTLVIRWWDGDRYRFSVGYVNENGIEPNKKYRLNDKGEFVEA